MQLKNSRKLNMSFMRLKTKVLLLIGMVSILVSCTGNAAKETPIVEIVEDTMALREYQETEDSKEVLETIPLLERAPDCIR